MLFGRRKRRIARILIVEDEPLVAFDNEQTLADAGYEVVATVDRCADAVAVLDREPLDLVLTDIRLTGERTGLDVARFAAARGVPLLFVTGDLPAEARGLGLGWLAKPYSARTLKAALDHLDRVLAGGKPAKPPPGLTLYGEAEEPV